MSTEGWIGVDLDCTLAECDMGDSYDPFHIGKPIQPMVDKVKQWLAQDRQVWIYTARVFNETDRYTPDELQRVHDSISTWCIKHIGRALPITYKKNPSIAEFWDDRARQVISNQGIFVEPFEDDKLTKVLRIGVLPLEIDPKRHGKLQLVGSQLMRGVYIFLVTAGQKAAKAALKKVKELNKATGKEDEIANAAYSAIKWEDLVDNVVPDLSAALEVGASDGIKQLELKQDSEYVTKAATEYAQKRAAEMIGKKVVNGKLVDNPDAQYVISQTTRDDIRDIIVKAFKENTLDELEESIKLAGVFSNARARLIAKTEIAMAQIQGNLDVWKRSGLIDKVAIKLSDNHSTVDICDDLATAGPYDINKVPMIPSHPLCQCSLVAVSLKKTTN